MLDLFRHYLGRYLAQMFYAEVYDSPFGQTLRSYALTFDGQEKPDFWSQVSFMDDKKLEPAPPFWTPPWGDTSLISMRCIKTFSNGIQHHLQDVARDLRQLIDGYPSNEPGVFEILWRKVDAALWKMACSYDRPGESKRVARAFGLFDPYGPDWPISKKRHSQLIPPSEPVDTPALATVQCVESIPAAAPSESASKSGHTYVKKQKKVKTKGPSSFEQVEPTEEGREQSSGLKTLPIALPTNFKLGKRLLKAMFGFISSIDLIIQPL